MKPLFVIVKSKNVYFKSNFMYQFHEFEKKCTQIIKNINEFGIDVEIGFDNGTLESFQLNLFAPDVVNFKAWVNSVIIHGKSEEALFALPGSQLASDCAYALHLEKIDFISFAERVLQKCEIRFHYEIQIDENTIEISFKQLQKIINHKTDTHGFVSNHYENNIYDYVFGDGSGLEIRENDGNYTLTLIKL